jgi:3-oxoacyl-(acyl-carrier-protein) synthase
MAAGLEALGSNSEAVTNGSLQLGVIVCVMSACVNYSRRFYDEALKDPSTASPLVFPETVFNAPASHIAAFLGSRAINYTLVGDPGTFLVGLATAADWLSTGKVDGCLIVGAEEADWLTAEAYALFQPAIIMGEGAGALFIQRE